MKRLLLSRSLGTQLSLLSLVLIVVVLGTITLLAGSYSRFAMRGAAQQEIEQQIGVVDRMLELQYETLVSRAREYAGMFHGMLGSTGLLSVDPRSTKTAGDYGDAPLFRAGYQTLNNNPHFVDRFAEQTSGEASALVRDGKAFVRVSTSLTDDRGERAIGTLVDSEHPAYGAARNGDPYFGLATLSGRELMTGYLPVTDDSGNVAGLLEIGIDHTAELARLRETIAGIRFGKTGAAFAIARSGDNAIRIHRNHDYEERPIGETPLAPAPSLLQRWLAGNGGLGTFTLKGTSRVVAYEPVDGWNWTLIAQAPLAELEAAGWRLTKILMMVCLAGALIWIAGVFVGVRTLLRPLRELGEQVRRFGDGDLTVDFARHRTGDAHDRNEIQRLRTDLAAASEGFRSVIAGIVDSARNVLSAASELMAAADKATAHAERQRADADQVAAAMTEMAQSVQEVAKHAGEASDAAASADQRAREGETMVRETSDAVERFVSDVGYAADAITQVEQASASIEDVIALINGISEQTKLLALNAAVESARAGQQGHGFSVVAEEVRALAQRTQSATNEVRERIDELQANTRSGVESIAHGRDAGSTTAGQSREAAKTLADITSAFSEIRARSADIAAAAEEQSRVAEEINRNAVHIRDISQETATDVRSSSELGRRLERMATALNRQIERFRIE